ncbi:hypothetical protein O3P69_016126 [Scylla paramamosain]|uniref:Uncharacterized protein n=1 Tax=Scylla paramamosain TaxID=85552 RepID=A0AAW0SE07_SCYPA
MDTGDMSNYQPNGEFDLVEFTAAKNVTYCSCCPEPYPGITFTMKLRRRPMFYVFSLILHCLLINGKGEPLRTPTLLLECWMLVGCKKKRPKKVKALPSLPQEAVAKTPEDPDPWWWAAARTGPRR